MYFLCPLSVHFPHFPVGVAAYIGKPGCQKSVHTYGLVIFFALRVLGMRLLSATIALPVAAHCPATVAHAQRNASYLSRYDAGSEVTGDRAAPNDPTSDGRGYEN